MNVLWIFVGIPLCSPLVRLPLRRSPNSRVLSLLCFTTGFSMETQGHVHSIQEIQLDTLQITPYCKTAHKNSSSADNSFFQAQVLPVIELIPSPLLTCVNCLLKSTSLVDLCQLCVKIHLFISSHQERNKINSHKFIQFYVKVRPCAEINYLRQKYKIQFSQLNFYN